MAPLGQLRRCSTKLNLINRKTVLKIPFRTEPILRRKNSEIMKMKECSPLTLSNPLRPNGRHRSCSCQRLIACSAFACTTENRRQWRYDTSTLYRAWTNVSTCWAMLRHFWLWTQKADTGRSKSPSGIATKRHPPPLRITLLYTNAIWTQKPPGPF